MATEQNGAGLAENKIGLLGSTLMGIAGTAPAFSIEVTTSTILAAVGVLAPASIFYCGLIMLGIAFAFINLNKMYPSAGTSYTWVSKIFGKTLGFFVGWSLLAAVSIFMVSGTLPIANATLLLFAPEYVNNVNYVELLSVFWLTFVSAVVLKGIKLSSVVQTTITLVEMVILAVLLIAGFIMFGDAPVNPISMDWFLPTGFTSALFVTGALTAMFFYWGWDVILNLSEETKEKNKIPGKVVFLTMIVLISMFIGFMVLSLMGLTAADVEHYNTNIIFALAEKVFGSTYGYIAIIVVLLSTLGTIETGMLQFTRTLFAKSRDGILHGRYSSLHKEWQTPWVATLVVWGMGTALIFASSYLPSVNEILSMSISAIGIQICFYLGVTGFACAYFYRDYAKRIISRQSWQSVTHFYYPLISAAFLAYIGILSFFDFDMFTKIVGVGAVALGAIPLLLNKYKQN